MSRWESPAPPLADWAPLDELVARHRRFVLTTHVNPDGDGLGSEVAMALYLRGCGKDVAVINEGAVPHNYAFLAESCPIASFAPEPATAAVADAEVLMVLDTSVPARLGGMARFLGRPGLAVVVLDHHLGEAGFAALAYVTPHACATGELVYDFVRRHPEAWTLPLAEALYTALVTDTGSFRFSNTDPAAHAMAAHLLELGVRPEPLVAVIYQHRHPDRLRFIGEVLRGLALAADGSVAWLTIERATMRRFAVDGADTEGLVDFPRTIPGVEAVALFTEAVDGGVKVSFRSAGTVDVDAVARGFGGGGHRAAAGATLPGPLPEARERVLARLGEAVARARAAAAGAGPA